MCPYNYYYYYYYYYYYHPNTFDQYRLKKKKYNKGTNQIRSTILPQVNKKKCGGIISLSHTRIPKSHLSPSPSKRKNKNSYPIKRFKIILNLTTMCIAKGISLCPMASPTIISQPTTNSISSARNVPTASPPRLIWKITMHKLITHPKSKNVLMFIYNPP